MAAQESQPGGVDPVRRRLLVALGGVILAACAPIASRARLSGGRGSAADGTTTTRAGRGATTPSTAPLETTNSPSATTTAAVAPLDVGMVTRDGWGARPPGALVCHTPVRLTYHHTAGAAIDPLHAPARMRGYQSYHMAQGWPDIAYHFVIDQAGRVYEGRPPDARGDTFTEYDPTGHFLVCLDGNFDEHSPSKASIDSLVNLLGWAAQTYGIDPSTLAGHRDYAATSCPGENLYALRDSTESSLIALLSSGRRLALSPDETDERHSPT